MVTNNAWNSQNPAQVAKGGTGVATMTTAYGVVCAGTTATGALQNAGAGLTGQPLVSGGAAALPTYGTLPIAGGGTGVASFGTSNGIVVFNGTNLVNYAGPQISSSGVYTNTYQVAFNAGLSVTVNNVTGNNTKYNIVFDSIVYNVGGGYNAGTGFFTAPVTGTYELLFRYNFNGITSSHTSCEIGFYYNNTPAYNMAKRYNPYNISVSGGVIDTFIFTGKMNSGDTYGSWIEVDNGTKVINLLGENGNEFRGVLLS